MRATPRNHRVALDRRVTSDRASLRDITDDAGFRGNLSAITHDDMVGKPRLPPHAYVGSHVNRTGEAALRGDHRPLAEANVVPDVHVRVESHTARDECGIEGARVDRRERTDLDVVFDEHAAELRHPLNTAGRGRHPTETRAADDRPCADEAARPHANPRVDDGVGLDDRIFTDAHVAKDDRAGPNSNPAGDYGGGIDESVRAASGNRSGAMLSKSWVNTHAACGCTHRR